MARIPSTPARWRAMRERVAGPLLAWFGRARRELPWREQPRDPYRVWVSEVMLQQTRVEVVVPYYRRFLRRFPTLRALARAEPDEVLALFSGLGYYARARNLHRAAREAAKLPGARLPRTSRELRALPGFGPYTAAAVASLAFGEEVPLVDGNVARVLARLFALRGDRAEARAQAWKIAPSLLPRGRAAEFNEALMELGALVCTPRGPRCGDCPLSRVCEARQRPDPAAFPAPRKRADRRQLLWAAVALRRESGEVLLARRGPGELFEGLWDLPSVELAGREARAPRGTALRGAMRALERCGLASAQQPPLSFRGQVAQTLTHRRLRVLLVTGEIRSPTAIPTATAIPNPNATSTTTATSTPTATTTSIRPQLRWVWPSEDALAKLPLSSLARKSLRACGFPQPSHLQPNSGFGRPNSSSDTFIHIQATAPRPSRATTQT